MTKQKLRLDYTIESPEERKKLVEQIIAENPNITFTPKYLETLADYLILCMEKQEKKKRKILTENRLATVGKRECSLEGLAEKFENGEDGLYQIMSTNRHGLFQPKISITQEDLDTILYLRQVREAIQMWERMLKIAAGRDRYIIKQALIELRKEQYIIKQAYKKPITPHLFMRAFPASIPLDDESKIVMNEDEEYEIKIQGVSLMNPSVVEAILCNYSKLKQDTYDEFNSDVWYLMQDFDNISDKALRNYPVLERIVELKIDKQQNDFIQKELQKDFGSSFSMEYISNLWRNKIPKLIAKQAEEDFIIWWWTQNNMPLKKCSRCGQEKPAHNKFFSFNKTSKDGFYSICKKCRNNRGDTHGKTLL